MLPEPIHGYPVGSAIDQDTAQPCLPPGASILSFFEEFAETPQTSTHSERRTPVFQNRETKAYNGETASLNRHFKAVFPRPRALRTGGHKKEYTLGNRMSLGSGPRPLGARRSDQNSRANAQAVLIPVFPPLFQTFARRYYEVSRRRRDPPALSPHLRCLGFHLVSPVLLNHPSPKEAQRSRGSPIRPNSR